MKRTYNIAISCIGSGVGQSVINSCKLSKLPIKTLGFGTNPLAYGLYDCDDFVYTPSIYSEGYVDNFIKIAKDFSVDLVIPGMDDEAHFFSQNLAKFENAGLKVIVASEKILEWCRDKELMSNELNLVADIFVKSFDKDNIGAAIESGQVDFPLIAKPRSGFASRGIEILLTSKDLERVQNYHIIQELAVPSQEDPEHEYYLKQLSKRINPQVSEISIQLVADKDGDIIGRMMSYNKLNNGIPIEVIPLHDEGISRDVDKLLTTFKENGLKGPLNLQGRLTDKGLKLFEMNARFTGITGLRAYMGFNEVEACIKSWLDLPFQPQSLKFSHSQFGVRQTADKAISFERNESVKHIYDRLHPSNKIEANKVLLISGGTGYLGQNLIREINATYPSYEVVALARDKDKARQVLQDSNVKIINDLDVERGDFSLASIDLLIHSAFARPHCTNEEIASSLEYTARLFERAANSQVPNIINISSQSVYGQLTAPPWDEMSALSPDTPYAMAKLASELIIQSVAAKHPHINFTSLRMGTLAGGANGLVDIDLLSKLTLDVFAGRDLRIIGGNQTVERLDIRDAVAAIIKLTGNTHKKWKPIYTLGSGKSMKLIDIAHVVVNTVAAATGNERVYINVEQTNIAHAFGLNSNLFATEFNWHATRDIRDIVLSLIDFYTKSNGL